jgi:hypothetical protein
MAGKGKKSKQRKKLVKKREHNHTTIWPWLSRISLAGAANLLVEGPGRAPAVRRETEEDWGR